MDIVPLRIPAPTWRVALLADTDVHTTAGPIVFRSPPVPPGARWCVVHVSVSVCAENGESLGFPGPSLLPLDALLGAHPGPPGAAYRPRFGAWRRADGTAVPVEEEPLEAPEGWTFEVPIAFDRDPQFAWRASVGIVVATEAQS